VAISRSSANSRFPRWRRRNRTASCVSECGNPQTIPDVQPEPKSAIGAQAPSGRMLYCESFAPWLLNLGVFSERISDIKGMERHAFLEIET
jgi:hypothetical protein